jgi:hypothetical protein
MKRWTQHQASAGLAADPPLVNDELGAQQSSATTLDRTQLPAAWVEPTKLVAGAILQVWQDNRFPTIGQPEQQRDAIVPPNGWMSSTLQVQAGGWTSISTNPLLLTGFKGGSLFLEWSCNVWVNNIFVRGINDGKPYSSNYMRLRALVNGVVIAERRGGWNHQTSRLIGTAQLPAGDLTVELQYQLTSPSEDWATIVDPSTGSYHVPYGHLWNSRYLIIARYR